ncbi:MAG: hypothetical protein EGP77_04860 [Lachnospiraceae bacterium]|nr:hypothetical protein [Lachnospiraceae bacterium]
MGHRLSIFNNMRNYSEPHAQNRIFDAYLDNKFTCYLLIVVNSPYKLCQICMALNSYILPYKLKKQ